MFYSQAFLPHLKVAANAEKDKPMSCSRAAIINMSTGVASISENSSGGIYEYRASKVSMHTNILFTVSYPMLMKRYSEEFYICHAYKY